MAKEKADREAAATAAAGDLVVMRERLYWRLMATRRDTIKKIEGCIGQLERMRRVLGAAAVDPLQRDYQSVLAFLRSIGPGSLPTRSALTQNIALLRDLDCRLDVLKQSVTEALSKAWRPARRNEKDL